VAHKRKVNRYIDPFNNIVQQGHRVFKPGVLTGLAYSDAVQELSGNAIGPSARL
jgi:hypothetical protein